MSRSQTAAMERWNVVVGRDKRGLRSVFYVQDDHARVAPCHIQPIVVILDLVALDDLLLAVRALLIQWPELLTLQHSRDVPCRDLMNVLRIAVVDNQQRFAIEISRKLTATISVLVVRIQSVA